MEQYVTFGTITNESFYCGPSLRYMSELWYFDEE